MEKSILFAEWLGQNHYKLYNVTEKKCYWVSESDNYIHRTTEELYFIFDNIKQ
jgi:hypothetical protein